MDELLEAWRAAEGDARRAYEVWVGCGGAGPYTVYRAEQDRADAAQDAVAQWAATKPLVWDRLRASPCRRDIETDMRGRGRAGSCRLLGSGSFFLGLGSPGQSPKTEASQ